MELIEKLGIDWKLLLAQIVNFLLILYILKRFAYKPILAALERRSKKIEDSLRYAREMDSKRAALTEELAASRTTALRDAEQIIAGAEADAQKLRIELLAQAKEDAKRVTEQTRESLALERSRLLASVREDVADLVVDTTEKVLASHLRPQDRQELLERATRQLAK